MSLIVQKYGGSSVASLDHLRRVAARIAKTRETGDDVVVVVSAMGKMTSELLGRAQTLTSEPAPRELDMLLSAGERISMSLLAMALGELGTDAISLTGVQAGIHTNETHFNARVRNVEPDRVREELADGRVVVVAGYQGLTPAGEVATLGRGGSDTTAVALAAALDAERCEICSDVDGIYSADPRVVPEAMRIDRMAYEDMLALAHHGARVLNARAVEYARETDTPVYAVSTFSEQGGTLVSRHERKPGGAIGIATHPGLVCVQWRARAERDTLAQALGVLELSEPFHYRASPIHGGGVYHEMLVPVEQLSEPEGCGERLNELFDSEVTASSTMGSVSLVGPGVENDEGTRQRFTTRLAEFECLPRQWLEAPDALSCLLPEGSIAGAAQVLHEEFIRPARKRAAA